jgi:hypothetical protein
VNVTLGQLQNNQALQSLEGLNQLTQVTFHLDIKVGSSLRAVLTCAQMLIVSDAGQWEAR